MQEFRADYTQIKQQWGGYSGFDAWVAQANNASLGAQAAYDDLVPGFEALFEQTRARLAEFYDAVRQLAKWRQSNAADKFNNWHRSTTWLTYTSCANTHWA